MFPIYLLSLIIINIIAFQSQEREAMQKMREKAKELQRQKIEMSKRGIKGGPSPYSMSSSSYNSNPTAIQDPTPAPIEPSRPSYSKPSGPSKALKLGGKSRDVESFIDQLKSEGERVLPHSQETQ